MWLFTRYGFFSVVCARQHGGKSQKADPALLMVRARHRPHLENLKRRFPALDKHEIIAGGGTDYPYRILVAKRLWKDLAGELIEEQTWTNFKAEAERFLGPVPFIGTLHEIWALMK